LRRYFTVKYKLSASIEELVIFDAFSVRFWKIKENLVAERTLDNKFEISILFYLDLGRAAKFILISIFKRKLYRFKYVNQGELDALQDNRSNSVAVLFSVNECRHAESFLLKISNKNDQS